MTVRYRVVRVFFNSLLGTKTCANTQPKLSCRSRREWERVWQPVHATLSSYRVKRKSSGHRIGSILGTMNAVHDCALTR